MNFGELIAKGSAVFLKKKLSAMQAVFDAGTAPEKAAFQSSVSGDRAKLTAIQVAQQGAGATAALLNAAKTALVDPVSGADIGFGGGASSPGVAETIKLSPQLFTVAAADYAPGNFLNNLTGLLQSHADFNTTGFIPVTATLRYSATYKSYWCWYDSAKVFISGTSPTDTATTQTAPAGAAFMRCSMRISLGHLAANMMVTQSAAPMVWQAYGYYVDGAKVRTLNGTDIVADSLPVTAPAFFTSTVNLYDWRSGEVGKTIDNAGSIGTNAAYNISGFIPVLPSTTYRALGHTNNTRFWAAYNANKAVIAGGGNSQSDTLVTPAGCYFVRVTLFAADRYSYQVQQGATATGYRRSGRNFAPIVLGAKSGFDGQRWAALGDSLTLQKTWTYQISGEFGLEHTNLGIGGTLVSGTNANAMWQDARINTIPTDSLLVTLLGMTNDWAQSAPIGAVDSTDTGTYSGALNVAIQKIQTRVPLAQILLITAPYSEFAQRVTDGIWTSAMTNTLGLGVRDYVAAMKAVAARWQIKCADVFSECGINSQNLALHMKAEPGLVHPNDTVGGPRISSVIATAIRGIAPVTAV